MSVTSWRGREIERVAHSAAQRLQSAGLDPDEARRDAVLLARHVLGWSAADWLTRNREPVPAGFDNAFDALIARRAARESVAHILGVREFYGRDFIVTRDVLVPRPETELIVEEALRAIGPRRNEPIRILDIGTGSGCLAVTLALELPAARIVATDTSEAALDVARRNVERHDVAGRVALLHGALAAAAAGPLDLVVSNPPYVPERDRATLQPEVRDHEPAQALFAGPDGLDIIRDLLPAGAAVLKPGGTLLCEIGAGQAEAVAALARGAELSDVSFAADLQGIPRVLRARLQASKSPSLQA